MNAQENYDSLPQRVVSLEEWRKYTANRMAEMHDDNKAQKAVLQAIERTLSRIQWLVIGMLAATAAGQGGLLRALLGAFG